MRTWINIWIRVLEYTIEEEFMLKKSNGLFTPVITLAISVTLVLSFTACNKSKSYNAGKDKLANVTLKCALIGGGDYEKLYEEKSKFEKNTGAKVQIVYKGNGFDIDKKIKMDFAADSVDYDVMWDHTSFFMQYIPYLEPLDKYFSYDDLSDFLPRLLNAGKRNGNLWLIPRHADVSALHYRTDLFNDQKEKAAFKKKYGRELKVPETWDDFVNVAEFFSRPPNLYGTQFAGKEEALTGRFYELLFSNGGEFIDSNGKAVFNSAEGIKSLDMLRELYKTNSMPKGMVNYLWDDVSKNFASGNVAMYIEWHGWYSYFQNPKVSNVAGKFDIARQPTGPTGIHGGWAGVHAFSIPKAAKNKEGAAALIKFFTSPENSYLEGKIGYLVVRTSVWDRIIKDSQNSKDPLAKKRLELAKLQLSEDFRTPPVMAEWVPASNILFPKIQSVILGEQSAKKALDDAAYQVNKLLDESK